MGSLGTLRPLLGMDALQPWEMGSSERLPQLELHWEQMGALGSFEVSLGFFVCLGRGRLAASLGLSG